MQPAAFDDHMVSGDIGDVRRRPSGGYELLVVDAEGRVALALASEMQLREALRMPPMAAALLS